MAYNFQSLPPPQIISDGAWEQTYSSMIQNNFRNSEFMPPQSNENPFNSQKGVPRIKREDNSHKEKNSNERDNYSSRDRSRRQDRGQEEKYRDRSRTESRGGSTIPPWQKKNEDDNSQLNQASNMNAQQSLMYSNIPMGNVYPGPIINASIGMMSGMMMDSTLMGLAMQNSLPVMPDPTNAAAPLMPNLLPLKGIIALNSCTLLPPLDPSSRPVLRDKPPGCRTIFVGGLIDNLQESVVNEIFEQFGEISCIRLSKKNFCHIRYKTENSVDAAVQLSGYRMRIDEKDSDGNLMPVSSWLHVDYAMARDDHRDFRCQRQEEERIKRHLRRRGSHRSTSPRPPSPHVVYYHYTELEADIVSDRIKQEETCMEAIQILAAWLERGDCCKKNVNKFYSLIYNTNLHVRRLLSEKSVQEEELNRVKDSVRTKLQEIMQKFSQVEKVFTAASHKKVWDHFTKAQRKNIDMWKEQSMEIRNMQMDELIAETSGGDEMDCSDDDDATKIKEIADEQIKQERESLQRQVEAYSNEVSVLQKESETLKTQVAELRRQLDNKPSHSNISVVPPLPPLSIKNEKVTEPKLLSENKARLIGIISTFLHIHPFGARTDYIWSYVQKILPLINPNEVESVLREFPNVFLQKISGVGANIERTWIYSGFISDIKSE